MSRRREHRLVPIVLLLLVLVTLTAAIARAGERAPAVPAAPGELLPGYFLRAALENIYFANDMHGASDMSRQRVYLAHWNTAVTVIDTRNATIAGSIAATTNPYFVALNPDGSRIYTHGYDHIRVFSATSLMQLATYDMAMQVRDMVVSDQNRLYYGPEYSTEIQVFVFDATTGASLAAIPQPNGTSTRGAYLALRGDRLYTGLNDNSAPTQNLILAEYDISGVTPVELQSNVYPGTVVDLQVSPDGAFLLARRGDQRGFDMYATVDLSRLALLDARDYGAAVDMYVDAAISADSAFIHLLSSAPYDLAPTPTQVHTYDSASRSLVRVTREQTPFPVRLFSLAGQELMILNYGRAGIYFPVNGRMLIPGLLMNACGSSFTDDFSNPDSGWPVGDSGDLLYAYENGQYRILHRDKEIWSGVSRGDVWDDSRKLAIDGQLADGSGWWGLIFYLQEDWSHFYTLEINPHLQMYIWTEYSDATGWNLISYAGTPAIQPGSAWNRLEAIGYYSFAVNVAINGTHIFNPIAKQAGYMGITTSSYEKNTDFRFDNYLFAAEHCPLPGEALGAPPVPPPLEMTRPELLLP